MLQFTRLVTLALCFFCTLTAFGQEESDSPQTIQEQEAEIRKIVSDLDSNVIEVLEIYGKVIEDSYSAKCIKVADGDTIEVLKKDKTKVRIRFESIDAPEYKQPFSDKSKQRVVDLCLNKQVLVQKTGKDRYGRTLAFVTPLVKKWNQPVNTVLLKEGLAWHYAKYSKSKALSKFQVKAKEKKLGLWSDPSPVAPWDWRKKK